MAEIHGVAGEWARVKGSVLGLWPLFLGVFAAGFSSATCMVSMPWGLSLLVVSLGFVIWSLMIGLRRVERFFKGARGEEKVSGILKSLPSAYHVFNDFAAGRAHVDHVVVGPGGVFAVETKFWRGKVTIEDGHILLDGQLPDRSPISQVLREAALVKQALAKAGWVGAVTPVLAFASDTFYAHRATLKGAIIINSCELKASFESDRVVIPPSELERLVGIMESNQ
ncbi:MAG: NERD domain-containing protein [Kiritimatiellae bacterium]|nr:NERD domain-containing protein [Kiritimatiellia bacterium]